MKKNGLKIFLITVLMCIASLSMYAQTNKISGKVLDNEGMPLVGVTVMEKGTNTGTITDLDGNYTIMVSNKQSVIVFTMIGFEAQETVVGDKTTINITFDESKGIDLGDVVVIGYGSVKKKDLTGAISSVSEKDFLKGGLSPDRLIVGKVAGVQVTPNGGAPGSGSRIRIRGGASLTATNDPLIIVDGVPLDNSGVAGSPSLLSTINPSDIESMNVLKDASATAIYGSRASNGVIIITTEQAKYGQKLNINFNTNTTVAQTAKKLDVLNGDQMRDIVNNHPKSSDEYRAMLGTHNTNWQDEIFKTAVGTDNNLSIGGSIKNIPFRASLGYTNEDGILRTSNMERFTGSLNLNPRLFDNHLKIDLSAKGSKINNRFAATDAIYSAIGFDPTQPVRDEGFDKYKGYFTWLDEAGNLKTQAATNPVLLLNEYRNVSKVHRAILSGQIDYKLHFLPEVRFNLNLAYDYSKGEGNVSVPEWIPYMVARKGQNQDYGNKKENKLLEFYVNYNKEFSAIQSTLDATAGYTYQDWLTTTDNYIDYNALGEEYKVPDFPFDKPQNTLISFFGRINYTLMDKYLLSATLRRDGSSRFHKDSRWGTFPSVALAWKIINEDFMKEASFISDLKFRVGYGKTGQQNIGTDNYPYMARYDMSTSTAQYQFGNEYYYMHRPVAYDKNIKWESTATYNVALDYGFLNNRISGSLDFYFKKTEDLLNRVNIPGGVNFSNQIITNIGSLENKGVELTVNASPIKSKDWNWDISFNATYNKNKITKLSLVDSDDYEGVNAGWIKGSTGGTVQIHTVGYNTYAFYLYKQLYDENGKPLEGVYADLNDDNMINNKDLYRTKSAEPKVTLGFSTNLNYQRWTLNMAWRASLGNYVYNNMKSSLATYNNIFSASKSIVNAPTSIRDYDFYLPQPLSDYYLENASFLKMDNISLTYDFGRVFKNIVGLRGTLGVQNVFTITDYSGVDPEIAGGVDRDFYPRPRTFSLGLNFSF